MRQNPALNWFIPLIASLAIITAGVGFCSQGGDGPFMFTAVYGKTVEIYGRGIYQHDSTFVATLSKGTALVIHGKPWKRISTTGDGFWDGVKVNRIIL